MTRRSILFLAVLSPLIYTIFNKNKFFEDDKYSKNVILEHYTDFQSIKEIAIKYNDDYQVEQDKYLFFEELVKQFEKKKITLSEIKLAINNKIINDFQKENIVFIEHWMLSITECNLASFIIEQYEG